MLDSPASGPNVCERILVVDDHESWQRLFSATLRKDTRWKVVETASDGVEAIRKAETLQPNLILMDVELPRLDGVEAAKRILANHRHVPILFVSAHRSPDIVEAAMGTGARGYVVKAEAGHDLPEAIDQALEGARYLSPVLLGRAADAGRAIAGPRKVRPHASHEAAFFAEDDDLTEDYARLAERALVTGKVAIVVAAPGRLAAIRDRLQQRGVDLDSAEGSSRYRTATVDEVLASFMVDGWPDETLFWKAATGLVVRTAAAFAGRPVRIAACGDCAGTLLARGDVEAAIRLEQMWDEVVAAFDLDVFCGYRANAFSGDPTVLHRIEQEHSAVHLR